VLEDPIKLDIEIDVGTLSRSGVVNWEGVQDALTLIASQYVDAFGRLHRRKKFYGFAFGCNTRYGEVGVYANTMASLKSTAAEYKKRSPKIYSGKTISELQLKLRWSFGDWEFQQYNTDGFNEAWNPVGAFLTSSFPEFDIQNQEKCEQLIREFEDSFMETVCRSMVDLESQGILTALSREDDFKTFVANHDELDETSRDRLEKARNRAKE